MGLIPARGGSKSIPLKNLLMLHGRPLISYVISAAKRCEELKGIVCSTDHEAIASYCKVQGVEVVSRPERLCGDEVPVADVMIHVVEEHQRANGYAPDLIVLLQPTSPFILPSHVDTLVRKMKENPKADSGQTITTVPHNYHALNQRIVEGDRVKFCFAEMRVKMHNKQLKPKHYMFGNVVVSRSKSVLEGKGPFGHHSLYLEIPIHYAVDIDGPEDVGYADYLLSAGKVSLV